MHGLTRKSWVAAFFLLISLGQAYPYAVAWAHQQKPAVACCCGQTAENCRCVRCPHHKKQKEKETERWKAGDCSRPGNTETRQADFRGDTFVVPELIALDVLAETAAISPQLFLLQNIISLPDPPPPRA